MSSEQQLTQWQQITFKNTESITKLIEQYGIEINRHANMNNSYYFIDHHDDDVEGLDDLSLNTHDMVYDIDIFLDEDAAAGLLSLMTILKDNFEAIKAYVLEHASEYPGD